MDIHVGQNKRASIEGGAGLTGRDSLDHNKEPQHRFSPSPTPKKTFPFWIFFFFAFMSARSSGRRSQTTARDLNIAQTPLGALTISLHRSTNKPQGYGLAARMPADLWMVCTCVCGQCDALGETRMIWSFYQLLIKAGKIINDQMTKWNETKYPFQHLIIHLYF